MQIALLELPGLRLVHVDDLFLLLIEAFDGLLLTRAQVLELLQLALHGLEALLQHQLVGLCGLKLLAQPRHLVAVGPLAQLRVDLLHLRQLGRDLLLDAD